MECAARYALSNGECSPCQDFKNCLHCSPDNLGICSQCADGFYNSQGTCLQCPFSNCLHCTSSQCLSFLPSYGQFSFMLKNTLMPAACDPGCKKCSQSQPTFCLECSLGYTLQTDGSSSYCTPCPYPCLVCSSDPSDGCFSCSSNYKLINL